MYHLPIALVHGSPSVTQLRWRCHTGCHEPGPYPGAILQALLWPLLPPHDVGDPTSHFSWSLSPKLPPQLSPCGPRCVHTAPLAPFSRLPVSVAREPFSSLFRTWNLESWDRRFSHTPQYSPLPFSLTVDQPPSHPPASTGALMKPHPILWMAPGGPQVLTLVTLWYPPPQQAE